MRSIVWLVLAGLLVLTDVGTAWANCFQTLKSCYFAAARRDNWFDRSLAGLDCELDFVECFRRKVGGW